MSSHLLFIHQIKSTAKASPKHTSSGNITTSYHHSSVGWTTLFASLGNWICVCFFNCCTRLVNFTLLAFYVFHLLFYSLSHTLTFHLLLLLLMLRLLPCLLDTLGRRRLSSSSRLSIRSSCHGVESRIKLAIYTASQSDIVFINAPLG